LRIKSVSAGGIVGWDNPEGWEGEIIPDGNDRAIVRHDKHICVNQVVGSLIVERGAKITGYPGGYRLTVLNGGDYDGDEVEDMICYIDGELHAKHPIHRTGILKFTIAHGFLRPGPAFSRATDLSATIEKGDTS
jgi:hypothetical protein